MPVEFGRVANVIVDSLQVQGANIPGTKPPQQGFRIVFKVTKTIKMEPNTCEVKIYNLAEDTRRQLTKRTVPVVLSAGYPGTVGQLFSGVSRTVDHLREDTAWVTRVRCGDGERQFQWSRITKAFAPGTKVGDVVTSVAQALGVGVGNLAQQLAQGAFRNGLTEFAHGYTAHGSAAKEFDQLMRTLGLTWSVQDGQLQVLRGKSPAAGTVPLWSEDTGLVGSPEHCAPDITGGAVLPPIVKAKHLLDPSIACGGAIQIQSQNVNGVVRVESMEHAGDTSSVEWYTTIESLPT